MNTRSHRLFNGHLRCFVAASCLVFGHSASAADKSCEAIFGQTAVIKPIRADSFERGLYQSRVRLVGSKTSEDIAAEIADPSIKRPFKFTTVQVPKTERKKFERSYDITLMGPLSRIFDLRWDTAKARPVMAKNESEARLMFAEMEKLFASGATEISSENSQTLANAVKLDRLTDQTVLMRIAWDPKVELTELEDALQSRFKTLYMRTANWTYRLSSLEPNRTLSSARMMDEVAAYANDGKVFDFNLLFDRHIWSTQAQVLQRQIEDYKRANSATERAEALTAISNGSLYGEPMLAIPLLPFAGVATARDLLNKSAPREVKRYFRNDQEDPLHLAEADEKNEYELRQRMLFRLAEVSPNGTNFEVHAHTIAHVRTYTRLGFSDTGLIKNPKYPDAKIHLLKASREEVMKRIAQSLSRSE